MGIIQNIMGGEDSREAYLNKEKKIHTLPIFYVEKISGRRFSGKKTKLSSLLYYLN